MELTFISPLLLVLFTSLVSCAPLPLVLVNALGNQQPLTIILSDNGVSTIQFAQQFPVNVIEPYRVLRADAPADGDAAAATSFSSALRPVVIVVNTGSNEQNNPTNHHHEQAGTQSPQKGSGWKWTKRALWVFALMGILGAIFGEECDLCEEKRREQHGQGDISLEVEKSDEKKPLSIRAEVGDQSPAENGSRC